jgi:hypothetical protein
VAKSMTSFIDDPLTISIYFYDEATEDIDRKIAFSLFQSFFSSRKDHVKRLPKKLNFY